MYVVIGISFLLHIISIFAIIVLYQRRTLERVNLPTMKEDVETLHHSMEAFIDEIEKENEHLYERMVQHILEREERQRTEYEAWENKLAQTLADIQKYQESILSVGQNERLEQSNRMIEYFEDATSAPEDSSGIEQVQAPLSVRNEASQEGAEESISETRAETAEALTKGRIEQIKSLYRQGFSVDHIAKVLQIGKGEAQLVVNLMKKK